MILIDYVYYMVNLGLKGLNLLHFSIYQLQVVSRYHDSQLQVSEHYSYSFNPLSAGAAYIRVFIFY